MHCTVLLSPLIPPGRCWTARTAFAVGSTMYSSAAACRMYPKGIATHRLYRKCTATLRDSSSTATSQAVPLHPNCLWVRKLPWDVPQLSLQQALQQACPGMTAVHIQSPKRKQCGTAAGADHRGYAVLQFSSAADADATAILLQAAGLLLGGSSIQVEISAAPIQLVPSAWAVRGSGYDSICAGGSTDDCTRPSTDGCSGGGGGHKAAQPLSPSQQTTARREHVKRNRQYKMRDRVQSLVLALDLLGPPGGSRVEAAYQQIDPLALPRQDSSAADRYSNALPSSDSLVPASNSVAPASNSVVPASNSSCQPWGIIHWQGLPMTCRVSERGAAVNMPTYTSGEATAVQERCSTTSLRVERKQAQVESFLLVLHHLLGNDPRGFGVGVRVVEFGCGSGNLLLPLAFTLPHCRFHAVDMKEAAVKLLLQRAAAAGLCNVTASVCRIEEYAGDFDIALALHACGSATDLAMLQAQRQQAAFICSPCCVGKIRPTVSEPLGQVQGDTSSSKDDSVLRAAGLRYPRSRWMTSALHPQSDTLFTLLARAADISHKGGAAPSDKDPGVDVGISAFNAAEPGFSHSHAALALSAKSNVELDRLMGAEESGYVTALMRLLRPHLLPTKSDLLVGAPRHRLVPLGTASARTGGGTVSSATAHRTESMGQGVLPNLNQDEQAGRESVSHSVGQQPHHAISDPHDCYQIMFTWPWRQ